MSLLNKIRGINADAARRLEQASFCTDSDIKLLEWADLRELFPGWENLKLRKAIFDVIHPKKTVDDLIRNLEGFVPPEHLRAALTNGILNDYLPILLEMKTQMNTVLHFLDAHVERLKEFATDQPVLNSDKGSSFTMLPTSDFKEVRYRTYVKGQTFVTQKQLMDQVVDHDQDGVQFVETSEDHQITVLFCPIASRPGTDVEAAMSAFKDDKPVILVLMHHEYEPKPRGSLRQFDNYRNVVLYVDISYHETKHGLIRCRENSTAISSIRNKLVQYATLKCRDTRGGAPGVGRESDGPGFAPFGGSVKSQGNYEETSGRKSSNKEGSSSYNLFQNIFGK